MAFQPADGSSAVLLFWDGSVSLLDTELYPIGSAAPHQTLARCGEIGNGTAGAFGEILIRKIHHSHQILLGERFHNIAAAVDGHIPDGRWSPE